MVFFTFSFPSWDSARRLFVKVSVGWEASMLCCWASSWNENKGWHRLDFQFSTIVKVPVITGTSTVHVHVLYYIAIGGPLTVCIRGFSSPQQRRSLFV